MLYLIGIGLKKEHLTLEAQEAIKSCENLYIEDYTSFYAGEETSSKQFPDAKLLSRKEVESSFLIKQAKTKTTGLLIFGNPLNATTHIQLLEDCAKENIPIKIIPGIGVFSIIGLSGLDPYKFGRTVTLVYPEKDYAPTSFYTQILDNLEKGYHTLCLLDIKRTQEKFMTAKEGLELLLSLDKENKLQNQEFIALCGISSENEKILIGKKEILENSQNSPKPQSLIIAGKINPKEEDFLNTIKLQ